MRTCSEPAGTSENTTSTCIHRCCGSGNDNRYSTAGSAHAVVAATVASKPINPMTGNLSNLLNPTNLINPLLRALEC
jgi:hypothetical protein